VQERFDIVLPVTVEHEGRALAGTSRNVSLGGMLLDVGEKLPLGAAVVLRFSVPRLADPIATAARVRWVDGVSGLGVQFDGLRAREVWALQQLFITAPRTP
jgi:predicted ATP-grasp superfamily ATP-dependent carboligase